MCDTDEPVSAFIEGCDFDNDEIISERVNYDPNIIKPILRDISDITIEEAIELVDIGVFSYKKPKSNIKIKNNIECKTLFIDFDVIGFNNETSTSKFSLNLKDNNFNLYEINSYNEFNLIVLLNPYKITVYILSKGFNLGLLKEGSYIIRNLK